MVETDVLQKLFRAFPNSVINHSLEFVADVNPMSTEERIAAFCKEFKPGVKRPAIDFFSWHNRLTGSCEKGRKEFARQHHIDIENDEMTPEEFFKLTRRFSYGGKIIRQTEHRFASISKD